MIESTVAIENCGCRKEHIRGYNKDQTKEIKLSIQNKEQHCYPIIQDMDIFSQRDYYPIPSDDVIKYKHMVHKKWNKNEVIQADIPSIIVHLSSPVDSVDYKGFSDFFLFYRNFLTPAELYDYLILRFKWCMREIESYQHQRSGDNQLRIGKVALIRTFVLLRHGILNHFADDFLLNENLRLRLISFFNEDIKSDMKVIVSCLISLKKAWLHAMKLNWDNVLFNEPAFSAYTDWIDYKIKDVSQLDMAQKRNSRFSYHGIQSISNPDMRNRSILSIYKSDNFDHMVQSNSNKISRNRTPSTLLFQKDSSNSEMATVYSNRKGAQKKTIALPNILTSELDRKDVMSNVTRMSHIIQDAKTLRSSDVNKIIPSTPAKKVELILNTIYSPDCLESENIQESLNQDTSSTQKSFPKGIMSLLARWKKNHKIADPKIRKPVGFTNKREAELDNFVKYVISISSLTNKEEDLKRLNENLDSKFDILSARTIDEVEYLFRLESKLLAQLSTMQKNTRTLSNDEFNDVNVPNNIDSKQISAMDNLDLFRTVNGVARSVISLTNSVNKLNNLSDHSVLDRRRVKSSMPNFYNRKRSLSGLSNYAGLQFYDASSEMSAEDDKPQKLVFHDGVDELKNHLTQTFTKPGSISNSSPLKKVLPNLFEHPSVDSLASGDACSYVTYDSQLSQMGTVKKSMKDETSRYSNYEGPVLKKKVAYDNLREFTFEDSKEIIKNDTSSLIDILNSPVTPDLSILPQTPTGKGSVQHKKKEKSESIISPASGRISIAKSHHMSLSPNLTRLKEDDEYVKGDNSLGQAEDELIRLEKNLRDSKLENYNTVVAGNLGAGSGSSTPLGDSPTNVFELPSSINMVESDMDTESFESSFEQRQPTNLREQYFKSIGSPETASPRKVNSNNAYSQVSSQMSPSLANKYLFSPDNESLDIASPVKNVEDLKSRFLKGNNQSASSSQIGASINTSVTATPKNNDMFGSDFDKNGLKNIMTASEEKLSKDPVELAMMKLEGTFKKNKSGNNTGYSSDLEKEVDILNIANLPEMNANPSDKRKSLMLDRRRQTMFNIGPSIYPSNTNDEGYDEESITDDKIWSLIAQYHIDDENLLAKNHANHVPFILMYESKDVAQQFTLIEREILSEIDWKDLLDIKLLYKGPNLTSWLQLLIQNQEFTGIDLAVARFNLTVDWAISEIVLTTDLKMRRNTIERFIHVAEHCRKLQNFNTMMQIILALNSVVVQKFTEAWRLIEPGDMLLWEDLRKIPALDWNYHALRTMMKTVDPLKGCIPFIVVYLSDLTINSEKNTWIVEKRVVNYSKFSTCVQIVKNFIQKVQWSSFYDIIPIQELLSKCVYISSLSQDEIEHLTAEFAR